MNTVRKVTGLILLAASCFPSSTLATTLLEAVNAAAEHDSAIKAAMKSKRAGNEAFDQGIAGLLPSVGLESNYTKQDQPHASYAAAVKRHSYSINLSQPLFDVAKIAALKRGSALSDIADVEFLSAQQKLVSEVSEAFFSVLYQREVLQATRAASQAFGKQLSMAKAALRIGEGLKTDVDEAQANYDRAHANEIAARNDLEVANGTYQRLTGLNADGISPINTSCILPAPKGDIKKAMLSAAENNLDVVKTRLQLEQTRSDVIATTAAHLPVVSFQASYGGNWSRGEGNNPLDSWFGTTQKTRNTLIGINVSMPLFNGGGQFSQSREALNRRDQARETLEDARRKASQEARSAWLGVTNGFALVNALNKATHSAANKVKSTEYGREVGLRTIVDVLNAQQSFYETQQNISEARYKFLSSKLNLALIQGQLNAQTLQEFACVGTQSANEFTYSNRVKG